MTHHRVSNKLTRLVAFGAAQVRCDICRRLRRLQRCEFPGEMMKERGSISVGLDGRFILDVLQEETQHRLWVRPVNKCHRLGPVTCPTDLRFTGAGDAQNVKVKVTRPSPRPVHPLVSRRVGRIRANRQSEVGRKHEFTIL